MIFCTLLLEIFYFMLPLSVFALECPFFTINYFLDMLPAIQNKIIFDEWASNKDDKSGRIISKIKSLLNLENCSDDLEQHLQEKVSFFCMKVERWWKESNRTRSNFERRHAEWLQKNMYFEIPSFAKNIVNIEAQPGPSRGRPRKAFMEISKKSKIRRVEPILEEYSTEELSFAAERSSQLSSSTNTLNKNKEREMLTNSEALALFYDLNLSARKYNILRSVVNAVHKDFFPSYYALLQTKKDYLPKKLTVTQISADVDLQNLLNKTVDSILKIENVNIESRSDLKLVCKWGFDGSSGHSLYKQKFEDGIQATDEFMFLVALVPLKLIDLINNDLIWSNPRPSSTLYCRPVKFLFMKEHADLVRKEEDVINRSINKLKIYELIHEGEFLKISYEMLFTMFDGSVSNVLSGTNSAAKCIICGATPKEMNSVAVLNKLPKIENYRFGLSSLHCWIRFFECLLHISYRLEIKSWQVKGEENKKIFEINKKRIQSEFKSKMGLNIDKPKPGYGSTNDGNTARRFFQNPQVSAEITRVDCQLIEKFSLILRIIASGYKINTDEFKVLLDETRTLYINLYNWYYMPSTIHKVLVHGCDIIEFFELPIGELSEDALEARHKDFRKIRLNNARKCSRIAANTDIIRTLLLTSDPHLASLRKVKSKENPNESDFQLEKYVFIENPVDYPASLDLLNLSETDESSCSDSE